MAPSRASGHGLMLPAKFAAAAASVANFDLGVLPTAVPVDVAVSLMKLLEDR
eukprot:CAMPEP_0117649378 /NCGR_PEP_ID=MMETSP0804-20121206/938_1 /TAXON_ID=1074897 /ORGANISM="Tetraselmis astigmatica, Strain CCMP880" /LENGTH=51 /DNA_ID=CAMNT_0005455107 /DNA_START=1418 /DNA_END=1573 /DNA_ORIENTATION=-